MSTLMKRSGLPSLISDFFETDKFSDFDLPDWRDGWISKMPDANVKESENKFEIELAAPGMEKKDFKINLENGQLVIRAKKEEKKEEVTDNYRRKEFSYNSFRRSFILPPSVVADDIEAKYSNGILKVVVPKHEDYKAHPRKNIHVG